MKGPTMRERAEGSARCTVKSPRSTERGTITCAMASAWSALPASGSWPRKKLMGSLLNVVGAASAVGGSRQHCAVADRGPALLPDMVEQHAGCHRDDESDHGRRQCRQVLKGRAWAQADETPADTEHGCPDHQWPIDIGPRRPCALICQDGPLAALRPCESGHGNRQRRHHDDRQARVPGTENIEKAQYLRGLHHAGNHEAEAENKPAQQGRNDRHDLSPKSMTRERNNDDCGGHKDGGGCY